MFKITKYGLGAMLAVVLVAGAFAPVAQAQTTSGSTSGVCPFSWTRDLRVGSTGADVLRLQQFLNRSADTRLSLSGAGSPGMETSYFGPITAAAVSKFQVKYAANVLTPLGLTRGTGYFGAASRAQANSLCTSTMPDDDDDDNDDDDNDGELSGGEADLTDFSLEGEDTNLEEGDEEVETLTAEFDVEDGDVRIERVEVNFEGADTSSDEPWDYLEEVTIMLGDEELETIDASDEDEWSEEDVDDDGTDDYTLTFSGLDGIVDEGETAELHVVITVTDNIDSDDANQNFTVRIPDEGIRAVDSEGINQYSGETSETETVNFDEADDGDLDFSESDDSPDDGETVSVEEDDESEAETVFVFEAEANSSDVEINELTLNLTTGSADVEDVVDEVTVEVDGEEYDFDDMFSGDDTTASTTFEFDDAIVIEEDEEMVFTVMVTFKAQEGNYASGETLEVDLETSLTDAEGTNTGDAISFTSASDVDGPAVSLLITDVEVTADNTTSDVVTDNSGETVRANYSITFDVTSNGDTIYILDNAGTSTTSGVEFDINGTAWNGATASADLRSDADMVGGAFRVDGTETFTLDVTLTSSSGVTPGFRSVELSQVMFSTSTNGLGTTTITVPDEEEFETDSEFISANN